MCYVCNNHFLKLLFKCYKYVASKHLGLKSELMFSQIGHFIDSLIRDTSRWSESGDSHVIMMSLHQEC